MVGSPQMFVVRVSFSCLVAASWVIPCRAWTSPLNSRATPAVSSIKRSSSLLSTSSSSSVEQGIMGGVHEFEEWFASAPGTFCLPSIRHAAFGSLRGLAYTDHEPLQSKTTTHAMTVPSRLVLSAPYADPDWDVKLASQLWNECRKGSLSDLYGYCSLLTLGNVPSSTLDDVPPSTAPNALRHWDSDTRQLLTRCEAGTKLLQTEQAQSMQWKNKYSKLMESNNNNNNMSWGQFQWCMEVVHSRAFCGIMTTKDTSLSLVATAAPVVAGGIGMAYMQNNPFPNDSLLLGLAVLGALPVMASFVFQDDRGSAVLLPLIDSANHWESADSLIEYNPLSKAFELVIGPKCLVKHDGEKEQMPQLFISYGNKSDAELLLNYGFLPDVSCSNDNNEAARVAQWKRLVESFVERNP